MKLPASYIVFAAVASAAAPARALPTDATTASAIGEAFFRLINTQTRIKAVEKRNHEVLSPALSDISRELHQGLNSDMFKIGIGIHNTLVDVNLKVGQIAGNASSILSQIASVANTINTLQFSDAKLDYNIKKKRIQKLCDDTLATTNVVLGLIDETKEMLGNGVSGPLKMLELTIRLTSDDKQERENADIRRQQMRIDNPPKWFLFFTDFQAVQVAKDLKHAGETTVKRVKKLVSNILDHIKWLEGECQAIREELESDRTVISEIQGKIASAGGSVYIIIDEFDSIPESASTDDYLREGSKALVKLMNNLRDEVFNVTRARVRRASDYYDPAPTEPYQIATEDFSPAVFILQPSWLDQKSDNGCFYIYNNRTTGCIFHNTFDNMRSHYLSLLNKFSEYQEFFNNYEKQLENVATQVLTGSKDSSENQLEAIKFVADLEAKKLLLSDDIKKVRDLSVSLNSYAGSLFSEAKSQLKITKINDFKLNEDVTRVVDDSKTKATHILNFIEKRILVINRKKADILRDLAKKVTGAGAGPVPKPNGHHPQLNRPSAGRATEVNTYLQQHTLPNY